MPPSSHSSGSHAPSHSSSSHKSSSSRTSSRSSASSHRSTRTSTTYRPSSSRTSRNYYNDSYTTGRGRYTATGSSGILSRIFRGIGSWILTGIVVIIIAVGVSCSRSDSSAFKSSAISDLVSTSTSKPKDSIYVQEIGRTCSYDGENYYDANSDCYFWFNDETSQWQYWFESISSKYGDYGWMEFDDDEGVWYIQTSASNWQALTTGTTSGLWHMSRADVNNYY